jgi:hypothetical protein
MTFYIIPLKQNMKTDNTNEGRDKIPENDPSKAMDSKKEVERSNDEKTDQDFPGYPHYPAREDIMDKRNDYTKENIDVENLPNSKNVTGVNQRYLSGQNRDKGETPGNENDELEISEGTDADVDDDDLAILNSTDAEIGRPQNVSNEDLESDLDIPGSELDDENEELGEEDEENNYYSLGGERHESQEEDPFSGPNREQ